MMQSTDGALRPLRDRQLEVAVIGCGYWGVNYTRVFGELPNTKLSAICDSREERLNEIGARFRQAQLHTSVEKLLENDALDAVVICTGATTHYPIAMQCLQAGKHVLVEKPLTTDAAQAEELIETARHKRRTLMVGHTFLYNSAVHKVKEEARGVSHNQIYYLYSQRTNLGPIRRDVNAVWDLAPHDVSIFNYLMDASPTWVSAVGSSVLRNGLADVGFITLGYPDGVIGNIHISWADPQKVRQLVVVSSHSRIVFNDLDPVERVKIYEKGLVPQPKEADTYGEYVTLLRDGNIISPHVPSLEPLKQQCLHFADCIANDTEPTTSGSAGLEVVKVLQAIDRSMALNGAPAYIQPVDQAIQPMVERPTYPTPVHPTGVYHDRNQHQYERTVRRS